MSKEEAVAQYLMATSIKAKEGREEEFKSWYDNEHLADMLKIPGVKTARTFEAWPDSPQTPPFSFVAIYELDVDDPNVVFADLGQRLKSGEMSKSDAIQSGTGTTWVFKAR